MLDFNNLKMTMMEDRKLQDITEKISFNIKNERIQYYFNNIAQ